jgi:Ca2+/Na+ antiporter
MKKTLKIISTLALILFGVLWVSSKLNFWNEFNSIQIRNVMILIYLFTSLKYFQMEVKDKNSEIQELKSKLEKVTKLEHLTDI